MSSASFSHPRSVSAPPAASARSAPTGVAPVPLALFGFELSLDTVPLDELEGVCRRVTREATREWFQRSPGTEEVAVLSTCHRVEVLVLARTPDERDVWREALPPPRDGWRTREGWEALHHLFRVAAGLESLAQGELEVSHQVRAAGRSVLSRHPRPVLREVLSAAAAGVREEADPETAAASIAATAVAHLRGILPQPSPRVLVVGSGTVGRQVVRSLAGFARVTLLYHERSPEATFLDATGADAVRLDRLRSELADADAVITAAKFGDRGLRPHDLPSDRPLVLVDLGMPRNIDPAVRELPNVRLVDLEELHALSRAGGRPGPTDRLVERRAREFYERLERRLWAPWVDAILRSAEATRRAELASARPFLGPLDPAQEVAIERLTRRLVSRLLVPPTERIRSLPPGPAGDQRHRHAAELFGPLDPDP